MGTILKGKNLSELFPFGEVKIKSLIRRSSLNWYTINYATCVQCIMGGTPMGLTTGNGVFYDINVLTF